MRAPAWAGVGVRHALADERAGGQREGSRESVGVGHVPHISTVPNRYAMPPGPSGRIPVERQVYPAVTHRYFQKHGRPSVRLWRFRGRAPVRPPACLRHAVPVPDPISPKGCRCPVLRPHTEKAGPGGQRCRRGGAVAHRLRQQGERGHPPAPPAPNRASTPPARKIKVGCELHAVGHDGDLRGHRARRHKLAVEEINGKGRRARQAGRDRRRGRRIRSAVFAQKAEKLIRTTVAAVFGGWTSSSRKAMLPVFESNDSAVLPVAVRGPGIQEHLLHRRHHQPADRARPGLPEVGEGRQVAVPGRQRHAFRRPPTRSSRPTPRPTASRSSARTTSRWARPTSRRSPPQGPKRQDAGRIFNTLNGDSMWLLQGVHQRRSDAGRCISVSIAGGGSPAIDGTTSKGQLTA